MAFLLAVWVGGVRREVVEVTHYLSVPWRILLLFAIASFVPILPIWRDWLTRCVVAILVFLANATGFAIGFEYGIKLL